MYHTAVSFTARTRGVFSRSAIAAFALLAALLPFLASAQVESLPDGMLVRTETDAAVYLVENGLKRPIVTGEAFQYHGLQWGDVRTVPAERLSAHQAGEAVIAQGRVMLPGEAPRLPDLVPLAAEDIRLVRSGARIQLNFTAAFWNRGPGPLELVTVPGTRTADGDFPAYQRVLRDGGLRRDLPVGMLFWHTIHDHYHYDDFADYVLEKVNADGSIDTDATAVQKTTFCMRDDRSVPLAPAGSRQPRTYSGCGGMRQGVSVGWADVYPYTLPDQFIDVTDYPPGRYRLSFDVDPLHRFFEADRDNNRSSVYVDLDPGAMTLRIVARVTPHPTTDNVFPDGAVLRAEEGSAIYAVRAGKRRQLHGDAALAAHGMPAGVFMVPQRVIDSMPRTMLVRVIGTSPVYLINEQNYFRRILNPEVFASYGFNMADVADISAAEFAAYRPNELVIRQGDNRVYSVVTKRLVGSFASLPSRGYDLASVHLVNDTDFNAYAMNVVAQGLTIPWGIAFLPDGDMLVTERPGTLRRIGAQNAHITIPSVRHFGEGGLMGIALHPDFADSGLLYLYFTAQDQTGTSNRVVRFRLDGDRLTDERIIVDGIPAGLYHDGGQLAFGPDGMLYVTTGDAQRSNLAQDPSSVAGKTLRYTPDGGIPSDNPFGNATWSYGHRNAQGIAWDAQGRMWQTEHGRTGALTGFDELNRIERGKNYGWPSIQGPATAAGMETPVLQSGANTTWAPSGIAYLDGVLYFAGLGGTSLYSVLVDDAGHVSDLRAHLTGAFGRLRAVVPGPDGALYLTTSNRDGRGTPRAGDDKIIRVFPGMLR